MVIRPYYRALFLGGGGIGGVPLDSHDLWPLGGNVILPHAWGRTLSVLSGAMGWKRLGYGGQRWKHEGVSFKQVTLPKLNSSPLKSYRNPIGKANVFQAPWPSGAKMLLNCRGCVSDPPTQGIVESDGWFNVGGNMIKSHPDVANWLVDDSCWLYLSILPTDCDEGTKT